MTWKLIKTVKIAQEAPEGVSKRDLAIPTSPHLDAVLGKLNANGHKALIVGGAVRDAILGEKPKDVDVEVYGTNYDDLAGTLRQHGKVNVVGKQFGVVKFTDPDRNEYDFSLPRKDSKTGVGHKDFETEFDPDITPREAASRRDFTFNAMAYDPVHKELHDYYGGAKDLKDRVIRHTSDAFSEDPLRVLRGMQFAGRYKMDVAPETAKLSKSIRHEYSTIPKERVGEEWMKLATKGKEPGRAVDYLRETGWHENFPALHATYGVPQNDKWHPEGTVDEHVKHSMNAAARIADREGLQGEDRAVTVFGAMCHDLGKPSTTDTSGDHVTSHGHDTAGEPITHEFLDDIGIKSSINNKVAPLVREHMQHLDYGENLSARDVRRLAERLHPATIKELSRVMEADSSGRPPLRGGMPVGAQRMLDKAAESDVTDKKQEPFVRGRDVMPYYNDKPGPHIGEVVDDAYQSQLNGEINSPEEGQEWLRKRLTGDPQPPKTGHRSAEMYHVSPSRNRESILRHGLRADIFYDPHWDAVNQRHYDEPPVWAGDNFKGFPQRIPVFAIPGQPQATYLVHSPEDAAVYAQHYWDRFSGARGRESLDLWKVRVPSDTKVEDDQDWRWTPAHYIRDDVGPEHIEHVTTWNGKDSGPHPPKTATESLDKSSHIPKGYEWWDENDDDGLPVDREHDKLYHVAPAKHRDVIQQQGLRGYDQVINGEVTNGVHAFSEPEAAQSWKWREMRDPTGFRSDNDWDIWEIDSKGLPVEGDSLWAEYEGGPNPSAHFIPHPVPPERIKRMDQSPEKHYGSAEDDLRHRNDEWFDPDCQKCRQEVVETGPTFMTRPPVRTPETPGRRRDFSRPKNKQGAIPNHECRPGTCRQERWAIKDLYPYISRSDLYSDNDNDPEAHPAVGWVQSGEWDDNLSDRDPIEMIEGVERKKYVSNGNHRLWALKWHGNDDAEANVHIITLPGHKTASASAKLDPTPENIHVRDAMAVEDRELEHHVTGPERYKPNPIPPPLPTENGLYWRIHPKGRPLDTENAHTTPFVPDEVMKDRGWTREKWRKPGYSSFWSPHHVAEYAHDMGWEDTSGEEDDIPGAEVVGFRGHAVGEGYDGEPTVMPHSETPEHRMTWQRFKDRLDFTPNGYGRWNEHHWTDQPYPEQKTSTTSAKRHMSKEEEMKQMVCGKCGRSAWDVMVDRYSDKCLPAWHMCQRCWGNGCDECKDSGLRHDEDPIHDWPHHQAAKMGASKSAAHKFVQVTSAEKRYYHVSPNGDHEHTGFDDTGVFVFDDLDEAKSFGNSYLEKQHKYLYEVKPTGHVFTDPEWEDIEDEPNPHAGIHHEAIPPENVKLLEHVGPDSRWKLSGKKLAMPYWDARPTTLWHVTDRKHRESIQEHGINPDHSETWGEWKNPETKQGYRTSWAWGHSDHAKAYAHAESKFGLQDIWEVDPKGLDIVPDIHGPYQHAWTINGPIAKENIRGVESYDATNGLPYPKSWPDRWYLKLVDDVVPHGKNVPWRESTSERLASWADVRNKAVRLNRSNMVSFTRLDDDVIAADVTGDHDTYQVVLYRNFPGSWAITIWECTCEWGQWAFKRQVTYVGRLCSHALATLYAAHGREYKKTPAVSSKTSQVETTTLYRGTTERELQHALQAGEFPHTPNWHRDVAAEVEDHYGLPRGAIADHDYYSFNRGRADDRQLYVTHDYETAAHYAWAGNEPYEDAARAAHRIIHADMYDALDKKIDDDTYTKEDAKALADHKKAFVQKFHEDRGTQPVVVKLEVPKHLAYPEPTRPGEVRHLSLKRPFSTQYITDVTTPEKPKPIFGKSSQSRLGASLPEIKALSEHRANCDECGILDLCPKGDELEKAAQVATVANWRQQLKEKSARLSANEELLKHSIECWNCPETFDMGPLTDKCPSCAAYQYVRGIGAHVAPKSLRKWMSENGHRAYMNVGTHDSYRKWDLKPDLLHAVQGTSSPGVRSIAMMSHPEARPEWTQAVLLHEVGHNIQYEDWDRAQRMSDYDREGDATAKGKELAAKTGIEWTDAHENMTHFAHGTYAENLEDHYKKSGLEKEHVDYPEGWDPRLTDVGKWQHGTLPTSYVRDIALQNEPDLHSNRYYTGDDEFEHFKGDIKKNGIHDPILIMVNDPGDVRRPAVQIEGHHRLLAAHQLGMTEVPVEVRYFGTAHKDRPDIFKQGKTSHSLGHSHDVLYRVEPEWNRDDILKNGISPARDPSVDLDDKDFGRTWAWDHPLHAKGWANTLAMNDDKRNYDIWKIDASGDDSVKHDANWRKIEFEDNERAHTLAAPISPDRLTLHEKNVTYDDVKEGDPIYIGATEVVPGTGRYPMRLHREGIGEWTSHNDSPKQRRDAMTSWTLGGSYENHDADEHHPLAHALEEAKPVDFPLHRGVTLSYGAIHQLKNGLTDIRLPMSSWTDDPHIAEDCAGTNEPYGIVFHVAPGAPAVKNTAKTNKLLESEREYISGGSYKVTGVKGSSPYHVLLAHTGEVPPAHQQRQGAARVTNLDKLKNYVAENHPDVSMRVDPDGMWQGDGDKDDMWVYSPKGYLRTWGTHEGPAETNPFEIHVHWNPNVHERDAATMIALHEVGHVLQAKNDWPAFHEHSKHGIGGVHSDSAYEREAFENGMSVAKQIGIRITPKMRDQWNMSVGGEHLDKKGSHKTIEGHSDHNEGYPSGPDYGNEDQSHDVLYRATHPRNREAIEREGFFAGHHAFDNEQAAREFADYANPDEPYDVWKYDAAKLHQQPDEAWKEVEGVYNDEAHYVTDPVPPEKLHRITAARKEAGNPTGKLTFYGANRPVSINVEVSRDGKSIQQGLMNRQYLGPFEGMVFAFPYPPSYTGFWMMNTFIPLSIAFWDREGRIIEIKDMEPCPPGTSNCPVYKCSKPYWGAVEVNRGFFRQWSIRPGDRVELVV